jgi:hypothetical protein
MTTRVCQLSGTENCRIPNEFSRKYLEITQPIIEFYKVILYLDKRVQELRIRLPLLAAVFLVVLKGSFVQ